MSEPENTEDLPRLSKKYYKQLDAAQPDPVLGPLVEIAQEGVEFNITLTVGGAVVGGTVIGRTAWYRSNIEANPDAEPLLRMFLARSEEVDAEPDDPKAPGYEGFIHLKNARHWDSNGPVTRNSTHWRGRLSSIDGWSLGAVMSPEPE